MSKEESCCQPTRFKGLIGVIFCVCTLEISRDCDEATRRVLGSKHAPTIRYISLLITSTISRYQHPRKAISNASFGDIRSCEIGASPIALLGVYEIIIYIIRFQASQELAKQAP